jgi:YTH domain-containing family protein
MSVPPHPISPPPGSVGTTGEQQSTGVRRHHTITAASRSTRTTTRATISEESQEQPTWNDEEFLDQEWGISVGAIGEKGSSSLHRQSSLPSRYNRGTPFLYPTCLSVLILTIVTDHLDNSAYGQGSRGSGSHTPRTLNSLSSIPGQEGEEEEWDIPAMPGFRNDEEVFPPFPYQTHITAHRC